MRRSLLMILAVANASGCASGGSGQSGAAGGPAGNGGAVSSGRGGGTGLGGANISAGGTGDSAGTGGTAGVVPRSTGGTGMAGAAGTGAGGVTAAGGTAGSGGSVGGAGGSSSACPVGTPWSGGTTYTSNGFGNLANGYSYQLWSSGVGSGSMTVAGVDAKFSATWNNPGDLLARVGLGWNSTKTYNQLGTISSDFAETKTGAGAGYNFIGIYGWSQNPLHEYYIVEDWFGSRPVPGSMVGTIMVDGAMYDVLTHTQTNQPSVTGSDATFVQFWSVRQTARSCGHISISQHFAEWSKLGLQLGYMEEARILVEVGNGGSGTVTFTTATVSAD
jgi:endo-1,4-beta-xylanase